MTKKTSAQGRGSRRLDWRKLGFFLCLAVAVWFFSYGVTRVIANRIQTARDIWPTPDPNITFEIETPMPEPAFTPSWTQPVYVLPTIGSATAQPTERPEYPTSNPTLPLLPTPEPTLLTETETPEPEPDTPEPTPEPVFADPTPQPTGNAE